MASDSNTEDRLNVAVSLLVDVFQSSILPLPDCGVETPSIRLFPSGEYSKAFATRPVVGRDILSFVVLISQTSTTPTFGAGVWPGWNPQHAIDFPSGENAVPRMGTAAEPSRVIRLKLLRFQSSSIPFAEYPPDARVLPSGDTANVMTS